MVSFGVIGCGHWGKNYVRVLQEIKGASVAGCADAIEENLRMIRDRHPLVATMKDAGDLIRRNDIDAIVVATPAGSHHRLALEALRAGKHLIVEKPLALTAEHCEEMIALAEKERKLLMVGHTFLYNDSVRKVKELVDKGTVGDIYYLNARRNHLGLVREDVAALWDLAPHDIAIFNHLIGSTPHGVSAVAGDYLKEGRHDVAFVTLFYGKNVLGNIQVSWVDSHKIREVVVIGSKQRVVFDDLNPMESVRIYEKGISYDKDVDSFGEFQYLLRDGDIISPKINHREPLKVQCQHFVECVQKGTKPQTDGRNGLDVVKVLLAATTSMDKKGAFVEIR